MSEEFVDESEENAGTTRREVLRGIAAVAVIGVAGCGGASNNSNDTGGADTLSGDAASDSGGDVADTSSDNDSGAACEATGRDAQGPFYEEGAPERVDLTGGTEPGEAILLTGTIIGLDCATPKGGYVVDVWQADASGEYSPGGADYKLRGIVRTDESGTFTVRSIKPGNYLNGADYRPSHVHFMVFDADGTRVLTTQVYFADDPYLGANDSCQPPTCNSYEAERIVTLADSDVDGATVKAGSFTFYV